MAGNIKGRTDSNILVGRKEGINELIIKNCYYLDSCTVNDKKPEDSYADTVRSVSEEESLLDLLGEKFVDSDVENQPKLYWE